MAREFGVMSYKPEEIRFVNSCWQFGADGEPWCYLKRMLCKNILLAAYRTPSTAEELAVELGVALPYMEDELCQLVDATLLKQNGRKYETNFFIVSARAQEKMYAHLRETASELTKALVSALEYRVKCHEENGSRWHEGYQSYEEMKWAILMRETDDVSWDVRDAAAQAQKDRAEGDDPAKTQSYDAAKSRSPEPAEHRGRDSWQPKIGIHGFTERPNGGEWDVLGFEEYKGDEPAFVGLNGGGTRDRTEELRKLGIDLCMYRFAYRNISKETAENLSFEEIKALAELAGHGEPEAGEEILKGLEEKGFAKKGEDGYRPAFQVIFPERMRGLTEPQEAEYRRLRDEAKQIALRHYLFCCSLIRREIPEFLKGDRHQIEFAVETSFYRIRGAVLEEALRTGWLTYEEDRRRMLGVYMVIGDCGAAE